MRKNIIKISLDVIMTVILVLLYNSHVFSIAFHEVVGLFVGGLFVIHCLLNKKWITSITSKFFSKTLAPRVRFGYIINFLLLITFILIITSGILTSQVLFPAIATGKGSPWRYVHHFFAAMSIVLVGVHIGLHWNFISGMFKRVIKIPAFIAKPLSIVMVIAIVFFGSYSIVNSSFIGWIIDPFTIVATNDTPENENSLTEKQGESDTTQTENKADASDEGKTEVGDENNHAPKQGENKASQTQGGDTSTHPEGEKKGEEGSPSVIASTIATYLSIFGVFSIITYYIDKLFQKKRKAAGNTK